MTSGLERFADGLRYYRECNWDRAIDTFNATLALNPNDGAAAMYIRRCEQLKRNPPPKDWGGIWFMKSK